MPSPSPTTRGATRPSPPTSSARRFCRLGIDPIVHFTCKDKNRNQIESILYALDRIGVHNLLVMTGDFPLYGFQGKAKPVYDLDSVQLLRLIARMNQGLDIDDRAPGGGVGGPPTHTVKGCAVSPFKQMESETMAQYFKLAKKVREGADFVITQVGFDARKFDELLRFMRQSGDERACPRQRLYPQPSRREGHERKGVPGCVVTDKLYEACLEESRAADKGKTASLMRAAKMVAMLRGIGYRGVHIGGPNLRYEDVEWVIGRSLEMSGNWESLVPEFDFPQPDGFYLYEKDPAHRAEPRCPLSPDSLACKGLGLRDDAAFSPHRLRPGSAALWRRMRLLSA